jgi:uncharacterized protein involved in copper resistance
LYIHFIAIFFEIQFDPKNVPNKKTPVQHAIPVVSTAYASQRRQAPASPRMTSSAGPDRRHDRHHTHHR